jgi:DNA-binding transcriptional ArsR family regulator
MTDENDRIDEQFKALRHARRRAIMIAFNARKESISPRMFSREAEVPLSNVSYHFRVLAQCGAVELVETKPVRGSLEHFYAPCPKFIALPWVSDVLKNGP